MMFFSSLYNGITRETTPKSDGTICIKTTIL